MPPKAASLFPVSKGFDEEDANWISGGSTSYVHVPYMIRISRRRHTLAIQPSPPLALAPAPENPGCDGPFSCARQGVLWAGGPVSFRAQPPHGGRPGRGRAAGAAHHGGSPRHTAEVSTVQNRGVFHPTGREPCGPACGIWPGCPIRARRRPATAGLSQSPPRRWCRTIWRRQSWCPRMRTKTFGTVSCRHPCRP